jgi:hypothetical protein
MVNLQLLKAALPIALLLLLGACRDDKERWAWLDSDGTSNSAPVIVGTPATKAVVGVTYEFVPDAVDADEDVLTFAIENRPSWATFSPTTGRLSGRPPASAAERVYAGIRISVSDKTAVAELPVYNLNVEGAGAGVGGGDGAGDGAADAQSRYFAKVPEIPLVQGRPETVQLGIWQLDPENRWTPGDFTRASGWTSRFPTRLVAVGPVVTPAGLAYDGQTGELRYDGSAIGDVTVKIERTDGAGASNAFRIRGLVPTVVYGDNAAAVNAQHGWQANLCESPMTFETCRTSGKFEGGAVDTAPLVIYFTPGTYSGQDFYLGTRRFLYTIGDPQAWPTLVGDDLANAHPEIWQIRNLHLRDAHITSQQFRTDAPTSIYISNVMQCCEDRDGNGVSNPFGLTRYPWLMSVWNFESKMMGSPSNTMHAFYIEGRPNSTFELNNTRFLGTRGSSAIKTTMQNLFVRHSFISTTEVPGVAAPANYAIHTMIDVPGVSNAVIYGNRIEGWRTLTVGTASGKAGTITAMMYFRNRRALYGADSPAYPSVSWDPPQTSQLTAWSPGEGWPKGPETFVSDQFWQSVKAKPVSDLTHPFTFKHYVGFNQFAQIPGSLPVRVLRDDGTHPVNPPRCQTCDDATRYLRTHKDWIERSVTFFFGNEYGPGLNTNISKLDSTMAWDTADEGSKWPRTADEEFPHAFELTGELPAEFRL